MFRNNLEMIIGPVCCGKSAELIRRVDRLSIAGYKPVLIKPKIDTRSPQIKSRNGLGLNCLELDSLDELDRALSAYPQANVIAIDEAQFFPGLSVACKALLKNGFKVIVSALDSDFNGDPFGDIIRLVPLSDSLTKLTAICMKCKCDHAIFSQKLKKGGDLVEIGDLELYHPRCFNCFVPGGISGEEGIENGA